MENKLLKKLGSIFIHTHAKQVGICSKCSVVCILSRPFLFHVAFIKLQESIFFATSRNNARFVVYYVCILYFSLSTFHQ